MPPTAAPMVALFEKLPNPDDGCEEVASAGAARVVDCVEGLVGESGDNDEGGGGSDVGLFEAGDEDGTVVEVGFAGVDFEAKPVVSLLVTTEVTGGAS